MNTTLEQRKEQAKEYMKQLKIYKPYIDGLMNENNVCYYEGFGGFWAYQNEELTAKIKEIERAWNVTVYAVTHEFTKFGECYSMLVVGDYPEEWEDIPHENKVFFPFAYVWNKSDDCCSEFGSIGVLSLGGGIKRIY